jgi:hypothetical protein
VESGESGSGALGPGAAAAIGDCRRLQQPHQAPDPYAIAVAWSRKSCRYPARAMIGPGQMLLINPCQDCEM